MGIKGLLKTLKGKQVVIDQDKTIGVDSLAILIESLTTGIIFTDSSDRVTTHINILVQKIDKLPSKQIWVFDNPEHNPFKVYAHSKRNYNQDIFKQISIKQAVLDLQKMLTLMGIAFITVDKGIEAEQALVEMYKRGFIDYIYSKDTDVLVYGGDLLTFIKGKFYLYTLTSVLEQFNITNKQFIHMCCLLENDFSPNVSGITIDTVLKRLDTPLGAKQIVDYIIFNKRLHMDKPEVTEKKVTKDLIEYLRDYDIIEASNRLEKKYTLDQS